MVGMLVAVDGVCRRFEDVSSCRDRERVRSASWAFSALLRQEGKSGVLVREWV